MAAKKSILVGLGVGTACLAGFLIFGDSIWKLSASLLPFSSAQLPKKYTLTFTTDTIPLLKPHPHTIEDSLFEPGHHVTVNSQVITTTADLWVTGVNVKITNAPTVVFHHSVLLELEVPDPICPIPNRRLLLFGSDTLQTIAWPDGYGVFIPAGTSLVFSAMTHNPEPPRGPGGEYKNVSISMELNVEEAAKNIKKNKLEYYQLALEDTACNISLGNVFTVPPLAQHFTKHSNLSMGAYAFTQDGFLTSLGAHFHPWSHGEKLEVYLNSTLLTTFYSVGSTNDAWSWTTPYRNYFDQPLEIKKGDVIATSVTYSNLETKPILDAMGMLGFYFTPK